MRSKPCRHAKVKLVASTPNPGLVYPCQPKKQPYGSSYLSKGYNTPHKPILNPMQ